MPELIRNIEELRRPRSKSDADVSRLNNELLNAGSPRKADDDKAKRNSKNALLEKIIQVTEKYELKLDYSDTKLKRMNKTQLTKVLAEVIEESVKIDMCKQVGCEPGASPKVLGGGSPYDARHLRHRLREGGPGLPAAVRLRYRRVCRHVEGSRDVPGH